MSSLPIVLAHGYLGFSTLGPFSYFNHVANALADAGAKDVFAVDVDPKGSIAERSAQLAAQIRHHVPTGKVHLIGHSMGGLDARYLISHANGSDLIATLTAVGSPFRGTFLADIVVDPTNLNKIGAPRILEAIARYEVRALTQWPFEAPGQIHFALGQLREAVGAMAMKDYSHIHAYFASVFTLSDAAVHELETANCARLFPRDQSDLAGVPICSYAGLIEPIAASPFLAVPAIVLDAADNPNDGTVALESATLHDHRATLPVDHIGLTGWGPTDVSATYKEIYARL